MTSPEVIITYLASEGSTVLSERDNPDGYLLAKTNNQRTPRQYKVNIPSFLLYLLRNSNWVPCEDGQKRRPNQIILARTGGKVLRGTFFNYNIDLNHSLFKHFHLTAVILKAFYCA